MKKIFPALGWLLAILLNSASLLPGAAPSTEFTGRFDQANKFFEQGKYAEAAAAYEGLAQEQPSSPTLHFNLGNARFKLGDLGRAIGAYRIAQRAQPRDPAIRFNLAFARKQLVGQPPLSKPLWQRTAQFFTQDEWALGAVICYWCWMGLLILRELSAPLRRPLRVYSMLSGALILLPLAGLIASVYQQRTEQDAVIVTSNAAVHYGPLAESQTHFQLRDGAEVEILDRKMLDADTWYRIEDTTGRTGWVTELDLMRLPGGS